MSLVEVVNRHKISLSDVQLSDIRPKTPYRPHVKAAIAEALVQMWLSKIEQKDARFSLDDATPRPQKGYVLLSRNHGILVFNGRKLVNEFDSLVKYDGRPYVVEVKSNGFNPDVLKIGIRSRFETARKMYGRDDVGMLLFFPIYNQFRAELANDLQREYRHLQCIDTDYTRKDLERKTKEFYKGLRKR